MPQLDPITQHIDPTILPQAPVLGLYLHVPFCFHKCHYCDFYSITRQSAQRMQDFVDRILREAELWSHSPLASLIRPKTIFFGGGTPSLLPQEDMRRLIQGLRQRFDLSSCDEWTVEANPATLDLEYCHMFAQTGVTRISMGAQSFDPAELAVLERHHNPDDVPASLELARQAGIARLNIDLIYAIPGQTMERWSQSLETAIALGTEHVSCYCLTYEPNTPLAVRKRMGQFTAASEDTEIAMLSHTRRRLAAIGLPAYEISNHATPGQECRHNLLYWNGGNYLGLGPSAASHIEGWRWKNQGHLRIWESQIDNHSLPATDVESLTPLQRAGELAMLQLRLSSGLELANYQTQTRYDAREVYAEVISRLAPRGLIEINNSHLRITEAGIRVADGIAAEFLAAAASFH